MYDQINIMSNIWWFSIIIIKQLNSNVNPKKLNGQVLVIPTHKQSNKKLGGCSNLWINVSIQKINE